MFSDLERWIIRYAQEITKNVPADGQLVEELKQDLSPEALMQSHPDDRCLKLRNRVNEALGTGLEH